MSWGIVNLADHRAPIVMLDRAQLCEDCQAISATQNGTCARCGSSALLSLAPILNRESSSLEGGKGVIES